VLEAAKLQVPPLMGMLQAFPPVYPRDPCPQLIHMPVLHCQGIPLQNALAQPQPLGRVPPGMRPRRHLAPPMAKIRTCLDWRPHRPQSHLYTMLTRSRARDAASPAPPSIDSLDEALLGRVFSKMGSEHG
jgi:hypothetical protein